MISVDTNFGVYNTDGLSYNVSSKHVFCTRNKLIIIQAISNYSFILLTRSLFHVASLSIAFSAFTVCIKFPFRPYLCCHAKLLGEI